MIWKHKTTVEQLNNGSIGCMVEHLGIEITEIGDDFLTAKMPVDQRTKQPFGLLHGGASVVLAETIGSIAANLCLENPMKKAAVGLSINANHVRSARSGYVYGTTKPVKIGKSVMVWNIEIKDEKGKMICVSRLTMAVIDQ